MIQQKEQGNVSFHPCDPQEIFSCFSLLILLSELKAFGQSVRTSAATITNLKPNQSANGPFIWQLSDKEVAFKVLYIALTEAEQSYVLFVIRVSLAYRYFLSIIVGKIKQKTLKKMTDEENKSVSS
jgi:hypothetical protein